MQFIAPITIAIISYNRSADLLALLRNIITLIDYDKYVDKVIVLNNASTDDYSHVEAFCSLNRSQRIEYVVSKNNAGVTGGRNQAARRAKSDFLFFIDDDAIIETADVFLRIVAEFSQVGMDGRPIGILACKVLYYDTRQIQKNAFPHKQFNRYKELSEFYTYYFIGCAHIVRRKMLEEIGLLPEDFFYGMEEYDLSYRAINSGYCIKYTSSIVVLHKESPSGRIPKKEQLLMMWVNKARVAWRYLSVWDFLLTFSFWAAYYFLKSNFDFLRLCKGVLQIIKLPLNVKRTQLNRNAKVYMSNVSARLSY